MDDKTGKEDSNPCACGVDHGKPATKDEIRLAQGHLTEHSKEFDALCIAAISGRLGMAVCKDQKTGEKHCTLCVLMETGEKNETGAEGVQVIPLARMIDGDPFQVVSPPEAGVMVMPATQSITDKLRKITGTKLPVPPTSAPTNGGMLN